MLGLLLLVHLGAVLLRDTGYKFLQLFCCLTDFISEFIYSCSIPMLHLLCIFSVLFPFITHVVLYSSETRLAHAEDVSYYQTHAI